jgi:pyruvate dehydrogenase E1 component alpha subunit
MEGHAVHDDAFYVPKDLFEEWAKRDPLERFRSWLRANASFSDEEEEEIGEDVKRLLSEAMRRAEESPMPDPATVLEGVYAEPDELDTPHHR